ncbi:DUF2975 domain-containing protein [Brevundimonas sp. 2R-24]|uniref:DUF2975 domain-containing protein n=2 Tax=Peiella sedimenti TaxID=3061083 RepID=A0ABT8SNM8_9CAUL|nr:DUF2975 domain-containing protein [Caulobacteraceae bacterium XZ-24]
MRALGPGSIASVLKLALDVVHILLIAIAVILAMALLAGLVVPVSNLTVTVDDDTGARVLPLTRVLIVSVLGFLVAYFGVFILIVRRLRRIVATVQVGDPFEPRNAQRLRQVGGLLAVASLGQYLLRLIGAHFLPNAVTRQDLSDLMTPGFAVLAIFVLAEVFREGARLRTEAELTI